MRTDGEPECERLREQVTALERRLQGAASIVDKAARETLLSHHPHHAIALLNEDEQMRLYALLRGERE